MGSSSLKTPGHDIAGKIVPGIGGRGQAPPMAREKCREIRDAAVIDIGVGMSEAPKLWIGLEIPTHILIDEKLEIGPDAAIGANDDIAADAANGGNIAAGESHGMVVRIIEKCHTDLRIGALDEALGRRRRRLGA